MKNVSITIFAATFATAAAFVAGFAAAGATLLALGILTVAVSEYAPRRTALAAV